MFNFESHKVYNIILDYFRCSVEGGDAFIDFGVLKIWDIGRCRLDLNLHLFHGNIKMLI